jgi:hypothetical protein
MLLYFALSIVFAVHAAPAGATAIVVFERWDTSACNRARVYPDAYPMLNLRFGSVESSDVIAALWFGNFTEITDTYVTFQHRNGTIWTDQVNTGRCIYHPVFSFGKFITIPGVAIAGISRRRGSALIFGPDPRECQTPTGRNTYVWETVVYYPISTAVVNASGSEGPCPTEPKYYLQGSNIASCHFGRPKIGSTNGVFNFADPTVHSCASQYTCHARPDTSCSAPPSFINNMTHGLFYTPFQAIRGTLESLRVVTSNDFPFSTVGTGPTAAPQSSTSAEAAVSLIAWTILNVLIFVF